MEIRPITGALGAEITGIDLSVPLDAQLISALRSALLEHLVIIFREQTLTPDQYRSFALNFGKPHVYSYSYSGALPLAGHPDILRVVKNKEDREVFGEVWHADVSFLKKPILGSMLYAVETPPKGGDTLFANMYVAYDALSDGMKDLLEHLAAVHESTVPEAGVLIDPPPESPKMIRVGAVHPVVSVHEETRRKCLNVNRTYTTKFERLTELESKPLLEYLFQHTTKAEFTSRLRWAHGTLAFWDNRCTQHVPINDYHGSRREMYRITVET